MYKRRLGQEPQMSFFGVDTPILYDPERLDEFGPY